MFISHKGYVNQDQNRYYYIPIRMTKIKKTDNTKC